MDKDNASAWNALKSCTAFFQNNEESRQHALSTFLEQLPGPANRHQLFFEMLCAPSEELRKGLLEKLRTVDPMRANYYRCLEAEKVIQYS